MPLRLDAFPILVRQGENDTYAVGNELHTYTCLRILRRIHLPMATCDLLIVPFSGQKTQQAAPVPSWSVLTWRWESARSLQS